MLGRLPVATESLFWFQVEANGAALFEREESCQSESKLRVSSSFIHAFITSLPSRYPSLFKNSKLKQIETYVVICEGASASSMVTVKEESTKVLVTCSTGA